MLHPTLVQSSLSKTFLFQLISPITRTKYMTTERTFAVLASISQYLYNGIMIVKKSIRACKGHPVLFAFVAKQLMPQNPIHAYHTVEVKSVSN